jgi:hypothetical protein
MTSPTRRFHQIFLRSLKAILAAYEEWLEQQPVTETPPRPTDPNHDAGAAGRPSENRRPR